MFLLLLSKGICPAINVKCMTHRYDKGCHPKNFTKMGKVQMGGGVIKGHNQKVHNSKCRLF